MGKATKRKPIKPNKARPDARIAPTEEAQRHGVYASAGMAYRRVAVIDTMLTRGQINDQEHRSLSFYRDQASLAYRSGTKSCLDIRVRGSNDDERNMPAVITSAVLATARIERDLGQLADIARAIAVDDLTLTDWCVAKHGGRERYDGKGNFIAVVPCCETKVMNIARLELRMAARRIVA